jgi:hypothetical protein
VAEAIVRVREKGAIIGAMAWKWYDISSYKVAVGAQSGSTDHGSVQLRGVNFYALLKFRLSGPLPAATAPVMGSEQRFFGFLDFGQMSVMVDILRNESPVRFGFVDTSPEQFHMMTGANEPVGEGE